MTTVTALETATAFNGTIVNTGVLCEMFDGQNAYFGVVSQDKTEFFPIHGIAAVYSFDADTVITLTDRCGFWEDQNPFALINEEHDAIIHHNANGVTNVALWEEIKRIHSTKNEGMFSA